MLLRGVERLLLVGAVGFVAFDTAVAQTGDVVKSNTAQNRTERLLQAIVAGEKLEGDASGQIPELIKIVESRDIQESELAICALARLGSNAHPAITAISKKLGAPSHSMRSAAADALVAIGDKSVVPVRDLLNSPDGKTRASASQMLGRLDRLDLIDLSKLAQDPEPRVRAAAASSLAKFGKAGVPKLVKMLQDPELAVSVEAARVLQFNRDEASIAVPRLADALSRAHLGVAAVNALSAYGVEARKAIPAIIKVHPPGPGESYFCDATEEALQHIGPPSASDIPQLCANLEWNAGTRIIVAETLGLLGLDGKSAADALEAAAESSSKEYVSLTGDSKSERRAHTTNPGRLLVAAEYCATAVWDVTHDVARYIHLIERLAIAADEPITSFRQPHFEDFPADGYRRIEAMLQHSNINVQKTALALLRDLGPKAEPLKMAVMELAKSRNADLSRSAIDTLAALGATARGVTEPVLVSKLHDGTIPLEQIADAVGHLKIRSQATKAILELGLHDKDRRTAYSCATTLCMTSDGPSTTARLIINAAREGFFENRDAIESMNHLRDGGEAVIPFLVEQLQSADYWTRHDAIDSLGSYGPKASRAIAPLRKLLDDESPLIRLKAAKAMFLIANEITELEKQLEAEYTVDPEGRWNAIKTITELGRSGGKFVRYPMSELHRLPPNLAEEAIQALQAIGTKEAVAALRKTAESSDWMLRCQATKALKQLGKHNGDRGI